MTNTLQGRLRLEADAYRYGDEHGARKAALLREAADEIQRLQVETEGRWQDLLNTQDRMIAAEEKLK